MKTICLLLAFCAVSAYGRVAPVIVGGREAPEGKYPYQVSLRKYGQHSCGASIINQRYILTAAHCIYRLARVYPAEATIHVGTNSLFDLGDVYDVERTIVHSGYIPGGGVDDIGLIRVTRNIEFNEKVQPIPLATTNFGKAGEVAVLTGWGTLEEDGEAPERLQEIDLPIEPQRSCKWFHARVSNAQICTLTKVGEGACHGDSGGPLVLNGVQIGLVSYSSGCAAGVPDVFTRVYHFQDWIKKNMMP